MADFKYLVIGICAIVLAAFVGIGLCFSLVHWLCDDDVPAEGAVTPVAAPVTCDCNCPTPKNDSIVADGYNVNITLDGRKWSYPPLNPEESDYVVLCRREDPTLINHPDLNFTETYRLWHGCLDELAMVRAGYDDDANQCCWQEDSFELPLPEPIRVPHQMTEAEHQEELRMMVGPDGEKYQ